MRIALLLGLAMMSSPIQNAREPVCNTKPAIARSDSSIKKVSDIIYIIRPEKGRKYANRIASTIVKSSKEYRIPAEVILTTGYVESEFKMHSKPCVGIMQVNLYTYKELDRSTGLNPNRLEDNVRLGTRELARYYHHPLASRYGGNWRLRYTWGRYNGAGPHSRYVRRALTVYGKIKSKPVSQLIRTVRDRHTLWR